MVAHTLMDPLLYNYRATTFDICDKINLSNVCFNLFIGLMIFMIFICILLWCKNKNTNSEKQPSIYNNNNNNKFGTLID